MKDLDPFAKCGRRKALAKLLGELSLDAEESEKFEILTSKKLEGGCLLHGVCTTDNSVAARARRQHTGSSFADFMSQKAKIQNAVLSAFRLNVPKYTQQFRFGVTISESTQSTRAEKVKLALSALKELNLTKEDMVIIRGMIQRAETTVPQTPMSQENGVMDTEREDIGIEMIESPHRLSGVHAEEVCEHGICLHFDSF